jgi:hypothetical protein
MNTTHSPSHEEISRRAHELWEEAGRGDGNDAAHWHQAERELRGQHRPTGEVSEARGRSVEPPLAGKHLAEKPRHSTDYVHPGVTTNSLHHRPNP